MTKNPTRSDRSEGVLFFHRSLGEAGLEFTQQLKTIPGAQALYCSQHIHFSSSAGCGEVLRWLLQFHAWKWGREGGGGGEGPCFVLFLEWLSPSISAGHKSTQQPSFYATFVGTRSCGHLSLQTRLGGEAPGQGDTLAVTVWRRGLCGPGGRRLPRSRMLPGTRPSGPASVLSLWKVSTSSVHEVLREAVTCPVVAGCASRHWKSSSSS